MLHIDLQKPVAWFRCGELGESHPEARAAFEANFLCSITMVQFAVDGSQQLWAFVGDEEAYKWDSRTWVDMAP